MTRKKSNLKLNRKKVSRFERKQKSLLQNETKNKTNIERSNGSQNQQRKQVTRVFSQRNTPRKKYLTFKRNSPRGKYSPFFSPNKKRVKLSSPSPRKLCSIKPNFVGLENKGHIEESDHSYHLLYKKALSRKALFVTSYPNPSDSLGNQYEDGISVLPEFEDIEVYCGDHFCVSQDSSETDKHDQQHFLSCITNRETSSKIMIALIVSQTIMSTVITTITHNTKLLICRSFIQRNSSIARILNPQDMIQHRQ